MSSSHPLQDDEERTGQDAGSDPETAAEKSERDAALDAMPEGNAEQGDMVAEEPSDPDTSDWAG